MNPISKEFRGGGAAGGPALRFSQKNCAICQRRLTVHQEVRGGVCDDPDCRKRGVVESHLRRQKEKAAALRKTAMEYRDGILPRPGVGDPASLRLAIIPLFDQPLVKLSRKRRAEFRAHLVSLLREVFDGKIDSADAADLEAELRRQAHEPSNDPAVGAACAVCRGSCCRGGGTRAYLKAGVIRSYMARNPGLRFREVLKAYLGKLPETACKGSCVYHGPNGCGLNREMRSSVCNDFYCDGMIDLRRAIASEGPKTVLLVAPENGKVLRSAIIDPDGKTVLLDQSPEKSES